MSGLVRGAPACGFSPGLPCIGSRLFHIAVTLFEVTLLELSAQTRTYTYTLYMDEPHSPKLKS